MDSNPSQDEPPKSRQPATNSIPVVRPAPGGDGEYTVIARRYRPQTFDQLVGQQHVSGDGGYAALVHAITPSPPMKPPMQELNESSTHI